MQLSMHTYYQLGNWVKSKKNHQTGVLPLQNWVLKITTITVNYKAEALLNNEFREGF